MTQMNSVAELKKGFAETPQQSKIAARNSSIKNKQTKENKTKNKPPSWNAMGT